MGKVKDHMLMVAEETSERILHALEIFPFISASMLHQAIGTATAGNLWKPILEQLVELGEIKETTFSAKTPTGRTQSYTIYHLSKHTYNYGPKQES
jgi:hypothetical protein